MSQWKLGYPAGLDSVSTEEEGRELYEPWLVEPIVLSPKVPSWKALKILSSTGSTITTTGGMTANEFLGGYCKIRSGSLKSTVFKVYQNTTDEIILRNLDGSTPSLSLTNEYMEVVTGPSTFIFPVNRDPNKQDVKVATQGEFQTFPYYTGGIAIPINYENDFILNCRFTNRDDSNRLLTFTKLKLDYLGLDAMATNSPAAPMILECGDHTANNQYLVHCEEAKEVREGMKGGIIEIMLYLRTFEIPSYRGY